MSVYRTTEQGSSIARVDAKTEGDLETKAKEAMHARTKARARGDAGMSSLEADDPSRFTTTSEPGDSISTEDLRVASGAYDASDEVVARFKLAARTSSAFITDPAERKKAIFGHVVGNLQKWKSQQGSK